MKRTIAITLTIFSLLLILDSFNVGHALMMFYLAGIIPGTNVVLSAAGMLEFFTVFAGFILGRITIFAFRSFKSEVASISTARA